jgi:hypothetical protein
VERRRKGPVPRRTQTEQTGVARGSNACRGISPDSVSLLRSGRLFPAESGTSSHKNACQEATVHRFRYAIKQMSGGSKIIVVGMALALMAITSACSRADQIPPPDSNGRGQAVTHESSDFTERALPSGRTIKFMGIGTMSSDDGPDLCSDIART